MWTPAERMTAEAPEQLNCCEHKQSRKSLRMIIKERPQKALLLLPPLLLLLLRDYTVHFVIARPPAVCC